MVSSKFIIALILASFCITFIIIFENQVHPASQKKYDGHIGMITIGFDHDYHSQIPAVENMTRFGYDGDLYTIVGYLNNPNYMNSTYLLHLQDHGWNIIDHSWTHQQINSWTTRDVVYNETVLSKNTLEKYGFKVTGYIPPRMQFTPDSLAMIPHNYNYTVIGTNGSNTLQSLSKRPLFDTIPLNVESVGTQPGSYIKNFTAMKAFVDYQISHKTWGIMHFHDIVKNPQTSDSPDWSCDPSTFWKLLQYIHDKTNSGELVVTDTADALGQ